MPRPKTSPGKETEAAGGPSSHFARQAHAMPGARPERPPHAAFRPQLAVLGDKTPEGDRWVHELKWDGYRLVVTIDDGRARMWSRNAIEWTQKLPPIRSALEELPISSAALDGELIAGGGSKADFHQLQAILSGELRGALTLVLFDLLHIDGVGIQDARLMDRKSLLEQLLARAPKGLLYSPHYSSHKELLEFAVEHDFEGIISKCADRPYVFGRSADWQKTKCVASLEFAVVGLTPAKGARNGIGALVLAKPEHGEWVYAGRVGSGLSERQIRDILRRVGTSGGAAPTIAVPKERRAVLAGATWFPPLFVAEVYIRGISRGGALRQPSLKAVRWDKQPADLMQRGKSRRRS